METADVAEAREKAEAAELAALEAEHAWRKRQMDWSTPTAEDACLTVQAHLLRSLAVDAFLTLRARVEMSRDTRSQGEAGAGVERERGYSHTVGVREGWRQAREALTAYVAELRQLAYDENAGDVQVRVHLGRVSDELEARFLGGPREPAREEGDE